MLFSIEGFWNRGKNFYFRDTKNYREISNFIDRIVLTDQNAISKYKVYQKKYLW
jgi:hypothetical protein